MKTKDDEIISKNITYPTFSFQNNKSKTWPITFCHILILLLISFVAISALLFSTNLYSHDILYHLSLIRSLQTAWQNGTFGNRIFELICQNYGYGTGLFYSMIPAGICVILMNVFGIQASTAIAFEFFFLFFFSSIVVYFFVKKVFSKNKLALLCSILWLMFPYFYCDTYTRFAFSEIFLMLAIPLIAFGIYELLHYNNKTKFFILFTIGFSLSILTHFTLSIFIALFCFIYICLNFKKFIRNKNWLIFMISCFFILIISACFYVPMLINYSIIDTSSLKKSGTSIYKTTTSNLSGRTFIITSIILVAILYFIFAITYFKQPHFERKKYKNFFIMSTILLWPITPLFPWTILNFIPFTMLQFAWRLLLLNALSSMFMFGFIMKNIKIKKINLKFIFAFLIFGYSLFSCLINTIPYIVQPKYNVDESVEINSILTSNDGTGSIKTGDYYPKGANNDYVFSRANSSMIIETNVEVTELANYQTINQFSFVINDFESGYIVLNIPYEVCKNLEILQSEISTKAQIMPQEYNLSNQISGIEVYGMVYLKIDFVDAENEQYIIINYEDGGAFDTYLQENPFEFVVKSGEANFSSFVKNSSSNYTVQIETNETTVIELPTLFYKGYKITYTTQDGTYELTGKHGENGFIVIEVSESGTLSVEFEGTYVTVSNCISTFGIVAFVCTAVCLILINKKNKSKKLLNLRNYEFN